MIYGVSPKFGNMKFECLWKILIFRYIKESQNETRCPWIFTWNRWNAKIPNFIAKFQSDLDDEMNNWATHMHKFLMHAKKTRIANQHSAENVVTWSSPAALLPVYNFISKNNKTSLFPSLYAIYKGNKVCLVLYLQGVYTRCLQHALYTSNKFFKVIVIQRVPISYAIYLVETLSFSEKRNEARTKFLDHPNPRE